MGAMATGDDGEFYFQLEDLARSLPDIAFNQIGQMLQVDYTGRGWRCLGGNLGYSMAQTDAFEHQSRPNPGYALLRDWAMKQRSTIGVLRARLEAIERHDVIMKLDELRQNPIDLYVVMYEPEKTVLNAKVRGRKKLWEGLISYLQSHVDEHPNVRRLTFFKLRIWSWNDECNSAKGQQIDIDVSHGDEAPSTVNGWREVKPSWHLLAGSLLRFSRGEPFRSKGNIPSASISQDENRRPKATTLPHREAHRSPPPPYNPRCLGDGFSGTQRPLQKTVHFSRTDRQDVTENASSLCPHESLPAQSKEDVHPPDEDSEVEIDLHRTESLPAESSEPETVTCMVQALCLPSSVAEEDNDFELSVTQSPSTFCLRSTKMLNANNEKGIQDNVEDADSTGPILLRSYSPSSSDRDHNTKNGDNELDLERDSLNGGKEPDREKTVINHRQEIRRVYFLPSEQKIREQHPDLWNMPGFHPMLKHNTNLIRLAMRGYTHTNGWYLVRVFISDDNLAKVQVALTVTYAGNLKHFLVLHHPDSNPRHYFLFNNDFEAASISELIDHYKTHPLLPSYMLLGGGSLPRLFEPIPRDSEITSDN